MPELNNNKGYKMKMFNRKISKGHIITILIISFCLIWMTKLEIEASTLKSILQEHHKSLESGDDALKVDFLFLRNIKQNSWISLMDDNAVIQCYKSNIGVQKNKLSMVADGDIYLGNEKDMCISYKSKENILSTYNDGSRIDIGKLQINGEMHKGIHLENFHGTQQLTMGSDIMLIKSYGVDNDFIIEFNPTKEYLKISTRSNSVIKLEKDFIGIEANGDINITSKKGKVNINGNR
jgi:hypothetical protein